MNNTLISTRSGPIQPIYAANVTTNASAIANPADTFVDPTGDGVLDFGHYGVMAANDLLLVPYGVGTATNTFLLSVFAWDLVPGNQGTAQSAWTAYLLASFTCTLCTAAGLAGATVDATQLYCGTIAVVVGNAGVDVDVISPTGNLKASIMMDVKGAKKVTVRLDRNGSATSCNTLARRM